MNTFFTGTYENKIDAKGRVLLPADFRDSLRSQSEDRVFFIFPSPRLLCLEATGQPFINKIVKSIEQQSDLFSDEEDSLSLLLAQTQKISFDSTGRFILPKQFEIDIQLKDTLNFVGKGQRFQIWNPHIYHTHIKNTKNTSVNLKLYTGEEK